MADNNNKQRTLIRIFAGLILLILAVCSLLLGQTSDTLENILIILAAFLVGGTVLETK